MTYTQLYQLMRTYQQAITDEIPVRLSRDKSVLVYSPMRSGKSKIIAALAQRIKEAVQRGMVPLVLTHRQKIHIQLVKHCAGVSIDADTDHTFIQPGNCYVAMNQTLVKRPYILSQLLALGNRLCIICDESHDGSFCKTLDMLPDALRVGFTATPIWKHAKHLPKYYASLIHGPQISDLIDSGNFVPVDYYEMVADLEGLRKQSNGEYTEASQDEVFGRSSLYNGLFEELPKFTFNKCAIFCASKKSADRLHAQFVEHAQYRTTLYYSGLPDYNLARFTELDECNVLITVRSLGTGWDYGPLDMCVLWCAMGSMINFLQTAARPCTPHPGKVRVTELDFGGNNSRFGGSLDRQALTMDRDYNELWLPPKKVRASGGGVGAIKLCPACQYMLSATSRSCCNCGFIYPQAEQVLIDGELVRIAEQEQSEATAVAATVGRKLSTLSAEELALWAKKNDKKPWAMRVAKSRTITDPTFAYAYEKAMEYKRGWADRVVQDIALQQSYEPDMKIEFNDAVVR